MEELNVDTAYGAGRESHEEIGLPISQTINNNNNTKVVVFVDSTFVDILK